MPLSSDNFFKILALRKYLLKGVAFKLNFAMVLMSENH